MHTMQTSQAMSSKFQLIPPYSLHHPWQTQSDGPRKEACVGLGGDTGSKVKGWKPEYGLEDNAAQDGPVP
jgi:hypothetical protein